MELEINIGAILLCFREVSDFGTQLSMIQLSHLYTTTGKTIALTKQTSVGKVVSLLFNMLSRLVIAFFFKKQTSFNFMAAVTI